MQQRIELLQNYLREVVQPEERHLQCAIQEYERALAVNRSAKAA